MDISTGFKESSIIGFSSLKIEAVQSLAELCCVSNNGPILNGRVLEYDSDP